MERPAPAVDAEAGSSRRGSFVALAILLGLFLAGRLVVWTGGRVFTSYDSASYAGPDIGELVSFTGHAPRLWGVPAFFALFADDQQRTFGQWTVGTLAWALLIVAVWLTLRTIAARVLATALTATLALLPQVTNWDFAILSESLSISLAVLTLALLILWLRSRSTLLLAALTLSALWWMFTRPESLLAAGTVAAVLAIKAVRGRKALPAIAAAIIAGGIGWAVAILPTVGQTFAGWSATGLPLREETLLYRLRVQVLPDPEVERVYRTELGMPTCAGTEALAAGDTWDIVDFAAAYRACPELEAWGERHASSSGYEFALAAPGPYAEGTGRILAHTLVGARYATVPDVLPAPVRLASFPPVTSVLLVLGIALATALAAAIATGAWRRRLAVTAFVVALVSLASVSAGQLFSTGENGRFGIQEAIGLRLAVVLLLVGALDSATRALRRASRR